MNAEGRKIVLFVCTHNSCRSQMAEGMINSLMGDKWLAFSAGTDPTFVNMFVIQAMRDEGIDISGALSKPLDAFVGRADIDLVVTVCDNANQRCPVFPNAVRRLHVGFADPEQFVIGLTDGEIAVEFARLRDEMQERLTELLGEWE